MIDEQYIWLAWASAFLIPWFAIYLLFPQHRRSMLKASLYTMPFGLTEPLFVPEYWSPPSLFNLALRTGFDIESLIFCFAIGGLGVVLYNVVTNKIPKTMLSSEQHMSLHRHHYKALAAPFISFPLFYFFPWNPIYPSIIAMFVGAIATMLCRPDLKSKTWIGGVIFLLLYIVLLFGLYLSAPDYIERVWNLSALSGVMISFMPLEELLFAFAFGMYWAGVYEHFAWRR